MLFRSIGLVACALLMGCASTASMTLPNVDAMEYRLSPGDRVRLEVLREDTISGEYVINDQGSIGLPMVGEVQAAGKTVAQLRTQLAATLRQEYVRDARINVDVVSYRPIYILGEVQKPGEYGYSNKMTVHALVAKAGGFTYRANEKVVYVRHADDAEERAYKLTSGATVSPGDTVRIDQRFF